MSIICDTCAEHICIEHPERCNPNMTAKEKLGVINESKRRMKCPCEVEAIHEVREVDGTKVMLDIDIGGEGLMQIKAVGQTPPEPYFDSKVELNKPMPKQVGFAIVCNYCPVCGRKLREET